MRGFSLASISAVSAIALAQIASAADLPRKAPAAPPAPVASWTGWYVGLNAGGTWGGDPVNVSSAKTFDCNTGVPSCGNIFPEPTGLAAAQAATGSLDPGNGAFIGGGQIGYNWQWTPNWVAGLEADIQGVAGKWSNSQTNTVDALSGVGFAGNFATVSITAS